MLNDNKIIVAMHAYNAEKTLHRSWDEVIAQEIVGLTFVENILLGVKLSEYHTGDGAFSREFLERLPLVLISDDFVFDNQMVAQISWFDYMVAEVSYPTKYFTQASSINLIRNITYGFGCLITAMKFRLAQMKVVNSRSFPDYD